MSLISLLLGKQYDVLGHLPEAVLVIDETGKIQYANKRAFKLFETQKLRGKNINEYFIINSDNIIANKDEEIPDTNKEIKIKVLKIISPPKNKILP